ncbi:hypothetical protein [Massilia soli]|uniref:Uncharacterized protein n=1 Tax=Massilia soli TaxID=2792854 RepID=A0ABS7SV36_9BURK|nr:hypothetical protein [Massilia soli]MBZ2209775.1 hypothetical protein [Massilia soli]
MKKLIALAAVAATLALSGNAVAHGSKAKHGGIVQTAGDLSFELVSKDGKTTIFVDDHGKDLPTAGVSGTLTVLKGAQKTAVPLEAAGGNMLVAKSDAVLAKGSKAVAAVTLADKTVVSVRFAVK